jgi:5-methyltetrahydropteroyltriglutamate--homocysteine methyltransferase
VILGVLALHEEAVENPDTVAERIRRALPHKRPQELIAAPDCGMKYLSRASAYGKLEALVAGARTVRAETSAPELA